MVSASIAVVNNTFATAAAPRSGRLATPRLAAPPARCLPLESLPAYACAAGTPVCASILPNRPPDARHPGDFAARAAFRACNISRRRARLRADLLRCASPPLSARCIASINMFGPRGRMPASTSACPTAVNGACSTAKPGRPAPSPPPCRSTLGSTSASPSVANAFSLANEFCHRDASTTAETPRRCPPATPRPLCPPSLT
mmetsp:Transcript_27786/g.82364  ORF Transcript_27786/g.82364 Transcript_27786/m.82364 type:complete len:201 (-) Transcript_27786:52-654(-)